IALTGLLEAHKVLGVGDVAPTMLKLFVCDNQVVSPRVGLSWDNGSDAQLLANLSYLRDRDNFRPLALRLITRLHQLVHDDGAIYGGVERMPADLDFLSGSVLLALANASEWIPAALDGVDLPRIHAFYLNRFRRAHPWGMVWWHGQAWSALANRNADFSSFPF